MTPKDRFIAAILNQQTDRPPVWMMRQAGRYLPEYRAIKEKHSTKKMMQTPEIAAEITMQPVRLVGVDAAIVYSDILMIPDALGMQLDFAVGEGPVFAFPIDSEQALARLNPAGIMARLDYVFKTVEICARALGKDFPVIGFAGAPFTVACYMINGRSSDDFSAVKKLACTHPKVFHELMELISNVTIDYLVKQADAGACVVQLFDTWAGLLSPDDYREFAKPYAKKIFSGLKSAGVKSIYFIKGGDYLLSEITDLDNQVIGVDWRTDLKTVRERTGNKYAIQGNLDPDILLTTPEIIKKRTLAMLSAIPNARNGYIANLGHGISQPTPVINARTFVETVKGY